MACYRKPSWNKHRPSAGCRHGLICFKDKDDLTALQVPHPPTQQCPVVLRFAKNRVNSGIINRREGESSEFFKGKAHRDWLTSNYDVEYCSKKLSTPTKSLPLSPTRKNNPHPLKEFIMHRIPGRTHRHPSAIAPDPLLWKYVNETFYEDCRDTLNDGDVGTTVPVTNVTKIPFPGAMKHAAQAKSGGQAEGEEEIKSFSRKEGALMQQVVKKQYVPVLKEWLKGANGKEKDMLMKFLKDGRDKGDTKRLEMAVQDIFQPGSADGLDGWLYEMPTNDKRAILDVLENLKELSQNNSGNTRLATRESRRFYGLPRAYRQSPAYPHSAPTRAERTRGKFQWSDGYIVGVRNENGGMDAGYVNPQPDASTVFKTQKPKSSYVYQKNPRVWYHRINTEGPPVLARAGGMFARPHRNMGQHWAITPEWPIA